MFHFILLLLLSVNQCLSANSPVVCITELNNDCSCFESTDGFLRIRCNELSIADVRKALNDEGLLPTVDNIELYNSGDTVLPENVVIDFMGLKSFAVKYGDLTIIEHGAFRNASELEIIDLRSNELTWLSGDMFEGISSTLKELYLGLNEIEYLYSDMETVFTTVTDKIVLNGNDLMCVCEIQWLVDLFESGVTLPDITGATCTDSNDISHDLESTNEIFTDCPDLCSLGYHDCAKNDTCIWELSTQTFTCLSPLVSSTVIDVKSSLFITPSPSFLISNIFSLSPSISPSPTIELLFSSLSIFASSLSFSQSESILYSPELISPSSEFIPPFLTTFVIPSSSIEYTSLSSIMHSQVLSNPSPSPSPSPSPFHNETNIPTTCSLNCSSFQNCITYCNCTVCQCKQGLVESGGDCIIPSDDNPVCPSDETIGLPWPPSLSGMTVSLPCCSGDKECGNMAVRTCDTEGKWGDITALNCLSLGVYSLQLLYDKAKFGNATALKELSSELLQLSQNEDLLPMDLQFLSDQISQTVNLVNENTDQTVIEDIVNSVSNLLTDNQLDAWQQYEEPSEIIAQLFTAIDELGFNLPISNGSLTIHSEKLVLTVISPDGTEDGWNISSTLLNNTELEGISSIFLPGSILQDILMGQDLEGCDVRIVVSIWDVETSLLQVNTTIIDTETQILVHGMCDWSDASSSSTSDAVMVNSVIISATLFSPNCTLDTDNLTEPIQITLHHINDSLDDPTCSFLDQEAESGQEWLRGGCRVQDGGSTSDYTVCECYHLTSFALLMSPTGAVTTSQPLRIATKVGLCISIIALVLTCILLFTLKLESKLNQVHRQLALSLCLSQIVFLVGVDRTTVPSPDAVCTTIAVILHYLLLCTFAWMLIEGIHLYLFIVKVFYNTKIVWLYCPLAWGIPLVVVAITLGVDFCDYGSLNYCWITTGRGANWAFHVPVIAVIIINIVVLVVVSTVVIKSAKRKDPDRCAFCSLLQASFILVPTLGLTWLLGFFVVGNDVYSTIVEWIFFACTTLQGLAIFVIHCVLNTEVRIAFLKRVGCHTAARKQKSVFSMRPSVTAFNVPSSDWRRRFSLGSNSRRGSLEPLTADGFTLQEKKATPFLDTVDEEDETGLSRNLQNEDSLSEVSMKNEHIDVEDGSSDSRDNYSYHNGQEFYDDLVIIGRNIETSLKKIDEIEEKYNLKSTDGDEKSVKSNENETDSVSSEKSDVETYELLQEINEESEEFDLQLLHFSLERSRKPSSDLMIPDDNQYKMFLDEQLSEAKLRLESLNDNQTENYRSSDFVAHNDVETSQYSNEHQHSLNEQLVFKTSPPPKE